MLENLKMVKRYAKYGLNQKMLFLQPPPHVLKITGVNEIQFYNKFKIIKLFYYFYLI